MSDAESALPAGLRERLDRASAPTQGTVPVPIQPLPVSSPPPPPPSVTPAPTVPDQDLEVRLKQSLEQIEALIKENKAAWKQVDDLEGRLQQTKSRVKALEEKDRLLQEFLSAWDRLRGKVKDASPREPVIANESWGKWLDRAGRRGARRRMLQILITHGEMSRAQHATLSVVSMKGSSYRAGMAWLRRNGLIEVQGEKVRLICP